MSAPSVHRHPAWFGSVMGTGAVSVVLLMQAEIWDLPWMEWAAVAFLLLASALGVLLWPRYARRLLDRPALRAELGDPGHGAMLGTFPAGILVLSVAWGRVGPVLVPTTAAVWIDLVLLVVGVVLAVALGVAWANAISLSTNDLAAVHGGWLIPPVMNLLVPLALLPVVSAYPEQAPWLLIVGFAFFGIGTVLFLVMLTLLVVRLALRPSPPPPLVPSLFIPLAPAGVIGFALLRLLQASASAGLEGFTSATAGVVVACMGVGFGLWWALYAWLEMRRIHRASGAVFHPGWWGFVFPVAAMTLSMAAVGQALDVTAVEAVSAVGAVILLAIWFVVAVRTIRLVRPAASR